MAAADASFIKEITLEVKLNGDEAEALKEMMRNPRQTPERQAEFDVRKTIFHALQGAGV